MLATTYFEEKGGLEEGSSIYANLEHYKSYSFKENIASTTTKPDATSIESAFFTVDSYYRRRDGPADTTNTRRFEEIE